MTFVLIQTMLEPTLLLSFSRAISRDSKQWTFGVACIFQKILVVVVSL